MDFAVSHEVLSLANLVSQQLGGTLVLLDKDREVFRVVCSDYTLDFSLFKGHNIEEDLLARDFTLNALALPLQDISAKQWLETLLDPCGGFQDLQHGLLRVTSPSSITDDALRAIRGIRLAAKFQLSVLPETSVYLKQGCRRIDSLAGERIWTELSVLLNLPASYPWIDFLDRELHFWQKLIAGRLRMQETKQNYYHVENVWHHSLRTFHCLELLLQELPICHANGKQIINTLESRVGGQRKRLAVLKLAALIHDIGKPDTAVVQPNGRISFHGHPQAGLPYADTLAKRLRLSNEEARWLRNLVLKHMEPLDLYTTKDRSNLTLYRFFQNLEDYVLDVLLLSLADITATYTAGERLSELAPYRKYIFALLTTFVEERLKIFPTQLLSGADIIALGISEGPQIGFILEKLAEAQVVGVIKDKESALQWVKAGGYREE